MAADVVHVEITERIPELSSRDGHNVRLFVTLHGAPLGYVLLKAGPSRFTEDAVRCEIARQLPRPGLFRVTEALMNGKSKLHGAMNGDKSTRCDCPGVSIVICTKDRPDDLSRCLDALRRLQYPNKEVIVVDNDPSDGRTREVAGRYPVVYLEERRPGLSFARNAGIRRATGGIIACTDDDCVPDDAWLDWLVQPFEDPDVMCVTGLVVPAQLGSEAQELFEEYGGLGRGFEFKVFDAGFFHGRRLRAVPTWHMGATANAAFRVSSLQEIGLFDVTLGVGTPTGCSEDTYAFYQLLRLGYKCVYEPRAYVRHLHRSNYDGLRRQLYGYSKGHYAYHTKCLFAHRDLRALFHMLVSVPWSYAVRIKRTLLRRSRYPLRLIFWEMLGNVLGPFSLLRSILRARRLLQSSRRSSAR